MLISNCFLKKQKTKNLLEGFFNKTTGLDLIANYFFLKKVEKNN